MDERLSTAEIIKDGLQDVIATGASTAGRMASIVTTAVEDVTKTIGSFATDLFEIQDGVRVALRRRDDVDPD